MRGVSANVDYQRFKNKPREFKFAPHKVHLLTHEGYKMYL